MCLKTFGRFLAEFPDCFCKFDYQDWPPHLAVLVDAEWAGDAEDRKSVDSVQEFFGKHLWDASSGKQALLGISSGEVEFYAIVRGAAHGIQLKQFLENIEKGTPLKVFSDASAARAMCQRTGSGRVRHLDIKIPLDTEGCPRWCTQDRQDRHESEHSRPWHESSPSETVPRVDCDDAHRDWKEAWAGYGDEYAHGRR